MKGGVNPETIVNKFSLYPAEPIVLGFFVFVLLDHVIFLSF